MLPKPREMPYEGYIIDTNGEVRREIHAGDKVRITRASQIEHLKKYIKVDKKLTYCKVYTKTSDILATLDLTANESKIIFAMLSHIGFGEYSGYLISVQCNMFNYYLNEKQLREIVNMSESSFAKAIRKLKEKEIIQLEKVGRDNRIIVNPFIFMKGNEIPVSLYEKFKNSKFNVRDK